MEIKHMELKKYALSDVCTIVPGFAFKSNDFGSGENIAVKIKDIEPPSVNIKNAERVCFTPQDKFRLSEGDYIMAMTGATIGKVGKLQIDAKNVYINQRVCKFNPITSVCDKEYLYYVLSTSSFRNFICNNVDSKLAQPNIGHTTIYKYTHLFPSNIKEQKLIASVLNNIDREIELNKQINDNLEAMAKQLYDYWFVQFDFPNEEGKPYKASGGAMVWNEKLKREIPQGWHCGTLLDIAEYTNGLACQKYRPTDNNKLPVIKIKEMHDGLSADTEWVKADIPDDVKVFDGDVLFSWSASLEVMLWAYGNGGLNQHIFKVTSKNGYPRSFYFYQLIHYVGVFKQIAEARKTTMGHITQDHLRQSTIALPPNIDVANKLEEKLCPIFDAIVKNNQEIMALTKQRDELLPLLMNGQASVNYHLSAC